MVDALRSVGASVQSLAAVGRGVPDLLVGFKGTNWLLEVKNPDGLNGAVRRGGGLTSDQEAWVSQWHGGVWIVRSPEEALRTIGAIRPTKPRRTDDGEPLQSGQGAARRGSRTPTR